MVSLLDVLRTLGRTNSIQQHFFCVRSVSLASKGYLPRPEGLSESWWDFAVLLEFFEPTEAAWEVDEDVALKVHGGGC